MGDAVEDDEALYEAPPAPPRWHLKFLIFLTGVLIIGGSTCLNWAWHVSTAQCKRGPKEDDPVVLAAGGGFALGMCVVICVIVFEIMNRNHAPHQKM